MEEVAKPVMDTTTIRDLSDLLSKPQCYCLNESPNSPHANLFMGDSTLALRSDADEQLMLHLEFNETVKVSSLRICAAVKDSASDVSAGPKVIKIFVNKPNIGFSEAEDSEPTQSFELTPSDVSDDGQELKLRFVKYQMVRSLSIFVMSNQGDEDMTCVGGLKVYGVPVLGTNVNDLKKC